MRKRCRPSQTHPRAHRHNMPCELLDDEEEQGGTSTKERFVAHDMFSLGVLLHYVLTSGEHPFGIWSKKPKNSSLRIQMNISDENEPNLSLLEQQGLDRGGAECAIGLVRGLVSHEPSERGDAGYVFNHPLFWSAEKRCRFIVESYTRDSFVGKFRGSKESFPAGGDWREMVDSSLWSGSSNSIGTLISTRNQKGKSFFYKSTVYDLVRFVRNIHAHFNDFLVDTQHPLVGALGLDANTIGICKNSLSRRQSILGSYISAKVGSVELLLYVKLYFGSSKIKCTLFASSSKNVSIFTNSASFSGAGEL